MRDTIDMAREAGFTDLDLGMGRAAILKDFEALVRADERSGCAAQYLRIMRNAVVDAVEIEREACHALRQTLPNPHEHCQVSAHAYDMALVAYGAAIRARGNT